MSEKSKGEVPPQEYNEQRKKIEGEITERINGKEYPCLDYTASFEDIALYAEKYGLTKVGVVSEVGHDNRQWYRIVPSKELAEAWINEWAKNTTEEDQNEYPLEADEFEFPMKLEEYDPEKGIRDEILHVGGKTEVTDWRKKRKRINCQNLH